MAKAYRVHPDAIAGPILWEGLENPLTVGQGLIKDILGGGKSTNNPGKIHFDWYQKKSGEYGGKSDAKIVEDLGLVTPPSKDSRELASRLNDPVWAITYIGAIARYHADNYRKIANVDISNNPGILSTLYQRGTSEKAARDFVIRRNTNPYATPEARDMGIWVEKNSKYITNVIKGDKNWPSASHNLFNMIKTGMQGSGISGLQAMLNKQGAGLKVDGIFGPKTNTAEVRKILLQDHLYYFCTELNSHLVRIFF